MKHLFKSLSSALPAVMALLLSAGILTSCNDDDKNAGDFYPGTEDMSVTMDNYWECFYFLPSTYDYGNYFFQLRNGDVGMDGFYSYPMNAGDYLLDIDIYTALDPDHDNPVLPEGRYHATESHQQDHDMVFTIQNTVAVYNVETLESGETRFRYIRFSDGTIDVKHTASGGYIIDCNFIAQEDGSNWNFHYEGELPFDDKSGLGDEDWWGFEGDTRFTPKKANFYYYDENDERGADNYIVRFFETDKVTADGIHLNDIGNKIQLSLYTAHGAGLAGTYTVRSSLTPGSCLPGERIAAMAAASFVERVRDDYSVRYALISEGTVTITENSDGTYSADVDCKTPEGATVKMTYRGAIEDITGMVPVYSTLVSDITFTPTACTAADYYGDYYGNGTKNYGFYLSNETELIAFEILSETGTADELPTGTFTISDSHEAGTMPPGTIDGNDISPTSYVAFDADGTNVVDYAPAAAGTLTITKSGSQYTFSFTLDDDADPAHKITGSVTCTVPELTDYTDQLSASRRLSVKGFRSVKTARLSR